MAILLNIDSAVETASVCLSRDTEIMKLAVNNDQKDHAGWLHNAIHRLIQDAGLSFNDLEAVAVSIGPGSYTGLRISLSAAKGLCYGLNIPLITINTLKIMAHAVNKENGAGIKEKGELLCPLIDARRMEVFAAVYDKTLIEIIKPCAMIVNTNSFASLLSSHKIVFCGNGRQKLQNVLFHDNAIFSSVSATAADLAHLAYQSFMEKKFASLPYAEPFYIKEFHSSAS